MKIRIHDSIVALACLTIAACGQTSAQKTAQAPVPVPTPIKSGIVAEGVATVRATVENWARLGPERALTGPIARGDEDTVARHRAAITGRAPELLPLYDALADATRRSVPA